MRRRLIRASVALVSVAALGAAAAHLPSVLTTEYDVEKSTVSWALYGEHIEGDEVYTIRLSFEEGFALPFELLVPHRSRWREHRPAFAVVGPGLPAPTPAELAVLPKELPAGAGAFVELNDEAERLVVFESFLRRMYWSTGPTALALPPGDFEIWVWSPQQSPGDFVMGFGVEEDFSGGGFGRVFDAWSTYNY